MSKMGNKGILHATKWATLTEIVVKLIAPISNMILARLLTPEAFGVVATASMVFSFADMFTDAGFQKYLIQHQFSDDEDRESSTNVAFWTNIALSFLFWALISIFCEPLATVVGNPGLGHVLVVSCISLPLTAFSSIQMALFKRDFQFKTLFWVRIVGAIIPLVVTIPLAFVLRNYWALIIGTICGNLANAIILTIKSSWKPKLYYNFFVLKKMLSFTVWTLIETVTIWLTSYVDIFLVGIALSTYYLGIYKQSMNTVNQLMTLITTSTTTVLFSGLSRAQNNKQQFEKLFFNFQRNVSLVVIPMGFGIFLFPDFITYILLGSQWKEAAGFIGLWGLVNAFKIVLSNYCSEAYRAMGKPKISVLVQLSQLIILIPLMILGAQKGFTVLYIMRCLVSCELIIANLITISITIHLSGLRMIINIIPCVIGSIIMIPISYFMKSPGEEIGYNCLAIFICILAYFAMILIQPWSRKVYIPIIKKTIQRIKGNQSK